MLLTLLPLPVLTLLGDVPVEAALPAQATFDLSAAVSGLSPLTQLLVTLAFGFAVSVLVSFWSAYVRRLGPKAAPWMLDLSAALNFAAGNPHKAARAKAAARNIGKETKE